MKTIISSIALGILLIGLLGFSGCSSSDAETSPAYNVQAIGSINGSELSVYAYVMDQEERLSSDAMITINGGPMNIGFFSAQDLNNEGEDRPSETKPTVQGVPSGEFQPFYFLDSFDLNEVDTVHFVAGGRNGSALLTSSNVVPKKLSLIEPTPDVAFYPGQEVHIKWQGADPYNCFEVSYSWGSEYESYSSGWLQDTYDYTIGPAVINEPGLLFIFVRARSCSDIHTDIGDTPSKGHVVYEVIAATVQTAADSELLTGNGQGTEYDNCANTARRASEKCTKSCYGPARYISACTHFCVRRMNIALARCRAKFCADTCR